MPEVINPCCQAAVPPHCCFRLFSSLLCQFTYFLTQCLLRTYHVSGIGCHWGCAWEKAVAPHSSTLAWKIPWTEEPGGLQSMGSLRVGHDSATSLSLSTFMHWERQWHPTPVFLPGESQGRGSLVGCRLWGHTESDTTEATQQQQQQQGKIVPCHRIFRGNDVYLRT